MKTLLFILCLSLFFCSNAFGDVVLIDDDFESYTSGTYPSSAGWYTVFSYNGSALVSTDHAYSGSKSFKISQGGGIPPVEQEAIDISSHNFIIFECAIYIANDSSSIFFIILSDAAAAGSGANFILEGGAISAGEHYDTNVEVGSYTTGVWYKLKAVCNVQAHTMDAYINDTPVASDIPIGDSSYQQFYIVVSNGLAYFDDVKIYYDEDDDGLYEGEDNCPCHPNSEAMGTCVKNVGGVVMSYEDGGELITCEDDSVCTPTGGTCQKIQKDCNGNGIGDVCERYADFNDSGDVNLVDLLDLITCYGKTNFETYPLCEPYDINDDNRVSAWDYLILTIEYGSDGFGTCGLGIAPARVAKTGQTLCYPGSGPPWDPIDCIDTGQDGAYQKGVAWPSPRFTDHGDGTVTDNLTGLMWTKDIQQILGQKNWSDALTACNDLDCGGHTDWRLPNIRELLSPLDYGEDSPALPLGHPFSNWLYAYYYTSNTLLENNVYAYAVHLGSNIINEVRDKIAEPSYVWCVRGKTNGPAPVVKTGQTLCYPGSGPPWDPIDCAGTGQDGEYKKGVEWPNPRFTDNGDGTVTDNLTGLTWLKDANCFGAKNWANALLDANGLADGACGLTDGSSAGDWSLPNVRELHSLIHFGYCLPALLNTEGTGQWTEDDPFTNVQSDIYWSSTTLSISVAYAQVVQFIRGGIWGWTKSDNNFYVWPVREGQ